MKITVKKTSAISFSPLSSFYYFSELAVLLFSLDLNEKQFSSDFRKSFEAENEFTCQKS